MNDRPDDERTPEEIADLMGRALKRALTMPHKPQKPGPKKRGRPRKRKLTPRRKA